MYNIDNDTENKKLIFTFIGLMLLDEGNLFIKDMVKVIKEIVPRDYILVIDGKEMKPFMQESISDFREALKFFLSVGFKNIYLIAPESLIAHNQCKRIMIEIGFNRVYINSPDEAV